MESAFDLYRKGKALLDTKNPAQAALVLERAYVLEPRRQSILEALATAHLNFGRNRSAARFYRELLDLNPSEAFAHFGLGIALKRLGELAEARGHLKLAVAMEPDSDLYRKGLRSLPPSE